MATRGIRGAITIPSDTPEEIGAATRLLFEAIIEKNPELAPEDIGSILDGNMLLEPGCCRGNP